MEDSEFPAASPAVLPPELLEFAPRIREWLLRLLCDCGLALDTEFDHGRFALTVSSILPLPEKGESQRAYFRHYQRLYRRHLTSRELVGGPLQRNLEILSKSMGLNVVEKDLTAFSLILRLFDPLARCVSQAFPDSDPARLPLHLARILGYSSHELERSLSPAGPLAVAGLMGIDRMAFKETVKGLLQINRRVLFRLTLDNFSISDLLTAAARTDMHSCLKLKDFDHMKAQSELVLQALKRVGKTDRGALRILFDGNPGLGKTEFARLVAAELGMHAYEILELDADEDVAVPGERIGYLRLIQRLLATREDVIIIFDEADAVLSGDGDRYSSISRRVKPMLIRLLEDMQIPSIWITNQADCVDPAVLRRFDLTIRFRDWTPDVRSRLLGTVLPGSVMGEQWVRSLERQRAASPARIAQADHLARLMADEGEHPELFRRVMQENLQCQLEATSTAAEARELPYRLESVNANDDLVALSASLARTPSARLCLYGPPGTGKTRFAQYLATRCGLELTEYRASDLLDAFLGQSEKNIREMFATCSKGDRLLFLDEADSLFRDRQGARNSWEVSQVNELLKGLERFQGLFLASTNLLGNMDSAVMRRIDFKLHFGWMRPDQAWRMFLDLARHYGLSTRGRMGMEAKAIVRSLEQLTPGDFALVSRRLSIRNTLESPLELARLLEAEVRIKPEVAQTRSVGFTARI